MSSKHKNAEPDFKHVILQILDESQVMAVATIRVDGWPQATTVGYVRDDLTIYFAVGRGSQKLRNIKRDPRISITLGRRTDDRARGLSLAARAFEVENPAEIERLNVLMQDHYPGQNRLSPREVSIALIKAAPALISVIDLPTGPGQPILTEVIENVGIRKVVHSHIALDEGAGPGDARIAGRNVPVEYLGPAADSYRRGAPL